MTIDYDEFRAKPWGERTAIFAALPAEERAALVRTHVTRWLDAHRAQLTPAQIEVMQANIEFIKPELYMAAPDAEADAAVKALEARTAELFSRDQMRAALTMHW